MVSVIKHVLYVINLAEYVIRVNPLRQEGEGGKKKKGGGFQSTFWGGC